MMALLKNSAISSPVLRFIYFLIAFTGIYIYCFFYISIEDGYFIAKGDFYQLLDPVNNYVRYYFAWFNQHGQGTHNPLVPTHLIYSLIAVFDTNTTQVKVYIFIILFGSFASFNLSCGQLKSFRLSEHAIFLGSILYAFNNVTLSFFTYSWGYGHHFWSYLFYPLLIALTIDYVRHGQLNSKKTISTIAIFCLSIAGYANPAFFVSYVLSAILLVTLLMMGSKHNEQNAKKIMRRVTHIFLFWCLAIGPYAVFYIITSLSAGSSSPLHSKVLGENNILGWLHATSNLFVSSFSLAMTEDRYPLTDSSIIHASTLAALLLMFIYFLVLARKFGRQSRTHFLIYVACTLVLFVLTTRLNGPFSELKGWLYTSSLFSIYRSPDKIFILLPYFISMSLVIGFTSAMRLGQSKIFIAATAAFLLATQSMGFVSNQINKALNEPDASGYRLSHKIPVELQEIKQIIKDKSPFKDGPVLLLPYHVLTSVNWTQMPRSGFLGADWFHLQLGWPVISANAFAHPNMETTLPWSMDLETEAEVIKQIEIYKPSYILWANDIPVDHLDSAYRLKKIIDNLPSDFAKKVYKSSKFELFALTGNSKYYIEINGAPIKYLRVDPTLWIGGGEIHENGVTELQFRQSYSGAWSLSIIENGVCGKIIEHLLAGPQEFKSNSFDYFRLHFCVATQLFKETFINNQAITHNIDNGWMNHWSIISKPSLNIDRKVYFAVYYWPQFFVWLIVLINGASLIALGYCGLSLAVHYLRVPFRQLISSSRC